MPFLLCGVEPDKEKHLCKGMLGDFSDSDTILPFLLLWAPQGSLCWSLQSPAPLGWGPLTSCLVQTLKMWSSGGMVFRLLHWVKYV